MAASHFSSSGRNEKDKGNEATLNVVIMAVAVVVVAASRVWSEYLRNCRPPGNWEHHYHLLGLQRMVPKIEKFPSARTHYWHTVVHWVFINQWQFHFCWSTSWISGVLHSFSALFFFSVFQRQCDLLEATFEHDLFLTPLSDLLPQVSSEGRRTFYLCLWKRTHIPYPRAR